MRLGGDSKTLTWRVVALAAQSGPGVEAQWPHCPVLHLPAAAALSRLGEQCQPDELLLLLPLLLLLLLLLLLIIMMVVMVMMIIMRRRRRRRRRI